MEVQVTNTVRSFDFLRVSEEEALALYSLLNSTSDVIEAKLMRDKNHWSHHMNLQTAVKAAVDVREKIMKAVDGN